MIRTLLATTALATLVSMGASAQEATTPAPTEQAASVNKADGLLATSIIGETVYNGTGEDAENIGEVNDILIGKEGNIEAVVVGVGGFLGIGEKDVAVGYAQLDWAEKDGDRWLIAPMTKEQLESQAAFDRTAYDAEMTTAAANDPAAAPTDTGTAANPEATGNDMKTAAIDKSTLTELPTADIRSEDMIGTTVYGADDANVGEIGDVILTADGKVDAYIIDVGGFLGVGEKEVAVGSDNLSFMTDKDGNKYLYTPFSKEQLEAAAVYDKATYAEKRDAQRLIVTQ